MDEKPKRTLRELHKQHREDNWPMANWRAWGSWFSWGSPVGISILLVSIGLMLWLMHLAHLVGVQ